MCIPLEIDRQTENCTNREALKDTHITAVFVSSEPPTLLWCMTNAQVTPNGCAQGLQIGPDMSLTSGYVTLYKLHMHTHT